MPDTAINMHGNLLLLTPHSLHNLRQCIDSRQRAIELSTTMIRHNDAIDAVVAREQRVFARCDAFDPNLHFGVALLLQPFDVFLPCQRRVGGVRVESYGPLG